MHNTIIVCGLTFELQYPNNPVFFTQTQWDKNMIAQFIRDMYPGSVVIVYRNTVGWHDPVELERFGGMVMLL
jgi:hypothetical protein